MCIYVEFVFITPRSFLQFSKLLNEDAVVRKMISEERSNQFNKQALGFPIGLLIRSPKKRLATLGRKPSNGSLQSNTSECTTRSSESAGVRQPARSKIRRHNNKLATVFNRSPVLQDSKPGLLGGNLELNDDPTELSSQLSAPGILKIFGSDICQGANYKSVLATNHSSAKELVKEALERYCLEKEDPDAYVLCDVIGHTGIAHQWQTECLRVIGDNEKPLILQSLWKPKEGFCRRFEIHTRLNIEERNAKDRDTITAGLNARMRNLQKVNSRVTSLFVDGSSGNMDSIGIWRSLSDMDLSAMGKEASRANKGATLQEDPEAEADLDRSCLITEKEETESSDDNNTQYSIHPPFDFPYFLLLQGYSHRQDFVIYLMSGNSCVFGRCAGHGEDGEQLKVDVVLYAPDVLPQHCCVQHLDVPRTQAEGSRRSTTLLKPLQGGCVTHNGVQLKGQAELFPGDLIGLGQHYLFMFKDPTAPDVQCIPTWMARLSPQASASPCNGCGSPVKRHRKSRRVPGFWKDPDKHVISLTYEEHQEDQVLEKILTIVDPRGPEPKLIPAFLLCLCIQHSAACWEMTNFCKLLLQIANQIQLAMWERTKELALLQPENGIGDGQPEPEVFCMLNIAELIQGLQPLVLWMANSIELLHFIQHEVPLLLPWTQQDEEQELINSEILSIRTASEEAMTVLEEVIMFTFQQTVYYLTRRLYSVLPGVLDSNPFSENGQMRIPEGVSNVLDVLKEALQLLNTFKVHSDITSQLLAYLFFFTNASLFNILMERGSGGGFYQWSKGVQIRANLDLLMDWTQSIGLGDLSTEFFKKLSSAVNLLATPKENLLQTSWGSLRVEFPHLNPAQLHHMLREYNTTRACPSCWTPSPEEAVSALQTSEILESFDNHPPLILPNNSFHLDLGKPITQPAFLSHLKSLQDFIDSLPINQIRNEQQPELRNNSADQMEVTQIESSPSTSEVECLGSTKATSSPTIQCDYIAEQQQCLSASPPQLRGFHNALGSCEALLSQKLKNLELQNSLPGETDLHSQKSLALDPSCLLTPPNTPQGLELSDLEASLQAEDTQNAENGLRGNTVRVRETEEDEDEEDEVFTVEVSRGPHGFGLALVDGLKSPLGMNGIYIKSVVPGSPAAQCQKLRLGDRILAVNGVSLVGMDYQTGREIIRTSGDSLRFLVAKTEGSSSGRSSSTRC